MLWVQNSMFGPWKATSYQNQNSVSPHRQQLIYCFFILHIRYSETFITALGTLKENTLTYAHCIFSEMFVINENHFEERSLNNILWNSRILSFATSSTFALSILSLVPWFSLGRWVGWVGNGHGSSLKEKL